MVRGAIIMDTNRIIKIALWSASICLIYVLLAYIAIKFKVKVFFLDEYVYNFIPLVVFSLILTYLLSEKNSKASILKTYLICQVFSVIFYYIWGFMTLVLLP